MKATSYELRQRAIMSDHFDTPSTLTNVKVLSKGRIIPQKLIRREFEHFDTVKGGIIVKVPLNLSGTLTDLTVDQNEEKLPQMHISKGNKHQNDQNDRLSVKVLQDSEAAEVRLDPNAQIDEEVSTNTGKHVFGSVSDQAAFIDFTPRDKLPKTFA